MIKNTWNVPYNILKREKNLGAKIEILIVNKYPFKSTFILVDFWKSALRIIKSDNKRGLVIIITIKWKSKAKHLYLFGLWFGKIIRVIEKYW